MISKKEFLEKLDKSEIKRIENIFRQIAEEKPYLLPGFKEGKFIEEARRIIGNKISEEYVSFWLSGYRRKKYSKL